MIAAAAGVIDDAPTFAEAFLRLLQFLLAIFGILVIILLVIAGVLYMTSGGSEAQATLAKKALSWGILGVLVGLGSFVLVRAFAAFFAV